MEPGEGLCQPTSVNPLTRFEAEAWILTKEEGGRTVGAGVVSKIIA